MNESNVKVHSQHDKLDEHSIKALSKGITSDILLVISFMLGTQLFVSLGPYLLEYGSTYYSSVFEIIVMLLIILNINIAGMVIGISGIGHCNQIKQPKAVKTTGSVLSILGAALNALGLTIVIIIILSPFYIVAL